MVVAGEAARREVTMFLKRLGPTRAGFWRCAGCGTPNPEASYVTHCIACGAARPREEGAPRGTGPAVRRSRLGRWVAAMGWAYLVIVGLVWAIQSGLGDRWWLGTLLLFGPRWVWGLPLGLLVPAAIGANRRALVPLGIAAVLVVVPVMGYCIPWRAASAGESGGATIRVLSCNAQGREFDAAALAGLIATEGPDIVVFQEWSDDRRAAVFLEPGWNVFVHRGLCVASRHAIEGGQVLGSDVLGWSAFLVRARVKVPDGDVLIHGLHLETPREGIEAVMHGLWRGLPALRDNIGLRWGLSDAAYRLIGAAEDRSTIIAGDFNLPADSAIFRAYWSGYRDAFAETAWGFGYTKRTRWFGARIDHILSGPGWAPRRCRVGPDIGSDHRPLIADFEAVP